MSWSYSEREKIGWSTWKTSHRYNTRTKNVRKNMHFRSSLFGSFLFAEIIGEEEDINFGKVLRILEKDDIADLPPGGGISAK